MKNKILVSVLFAFILLAFKKVNDVLSDMGSTLEEVKQITREQISKKDLSSPDFTAQIKNACKKLPAGVREATMMSLGKIIKDYVESPQFQTDYIAHLSSRSVGRRAPGGPQGDEKWTAERKKKTDQLAKALANEQFLEMSAKNLDGQLDVAETMLNLKKENPDMQAGKPKQ